MDPADYLNDHDSTIYSKNLTTNKAMQKLSAQMKLSVKLMSSVTKKYKPNEVSLYKFVIDHKNPNTLAQFEKVARDGKLEHARLHALCLSEFQELGEMVFNMIKKFFGNFKQSNFDHRMYCLLVNKMTNLDLRGYHEMMFSFFDTNRDKLVSEYDLFKFLHTIKSSDNLLHLHNDILAVFRVLEDKRKAEGKHDFINIHLQLIQKNIETALKTKQLVDRPDC